MRFPFVQKQAEDKETSSDGFKKRLLEPCGEEVLSARVCFSSRLAVRLS